MDAASVHAQQSEALPVQTIERAFSEGDVERLMGCAADRLEMAVLSSGMLFSRGQAAYVMGKFFRQYPPDEFSVKDVSQAGGNWFATGTYKATGEARTFRVYLRFRRAAEGWMLTEVRIGGGS